MLKSSSRTPRTRPRDTPLRCRAVVEEGVAKCLDLRLRLLERLVGEVDRLAPVRAMKNRSTTSSPTCRARCGATHRCRATSTSSRRRTRATRCASRCARNRGRARSTAQARSRDAGRRGRARRRGSRRPGRTPPPPSPSTRCANPAGRAPRAHPRRCPRPASAPSRARSRADPPSAGSAPRCSIWSGRCPERRPYPGSLATRK